MKQACRFLAVLVAVIGIAPAFGGVVPGQWEKVEAVEPGSQIVVFLKSGDRIEGTFKEVGEQDLAIADGQGERRLPKTSVAKIETAPFDDGKGDGTLTGAALGALGLGVLGALAGSMDDESNNTGQAAAFGAALGAGAGAGIGFALDSAKKGSTVLYKAP